MKLLIAIPTHDYMNAQFVESLTKMMRHLTLEGIDYDVKFKIGTLVHIARDEIVKENLYEGYTHVLWLDSDMVFDSDIVDILLKAGKEIVTAVCRGRHGDHKLCIFKDSISADRFKDIPENLTEIDGCGMACVLMNSKVLYDVFMANGTCFLPTVRLGEDLAFCKRAKECGYDIYCEPKAKCGHIAQKVIWP